MDISGLGITAAAFAGSVAVTNGGGSTLVTIGADSIRLLGVAPGAIDATDFRFAP